jgi:hypothetical protein
MTLAARASRRSVLGAVVLAAMGAAAPAAAQVDAREALRRFAAAAKSEARELRADTKAARATLFAQLAAFEIQVRAGSFSDGLANALFDDLDAFQGAVRGALSVAAGDVNGARRAALAALAGGGPLGTFPLGFYDGDGGPFDDFRSGAEPALAKLYASVNKRLENTERLVEREADVGLLLWLGPPGGLNAASSSDAEAAVFTSELVIDTLMSASDLFVAPSGRLWVGGSIGEQPQLDVRLFDAGGGLLAQAGAAVAAPRWQASFVNLFPGSYGISVIYNPSVGAFRAASFGVR